MNSSPDCTASSWHVWVDGATDPWQMRKNVCWIYRLTETGYSRDRNTVTLQSKAPKLDSSSSTVSHKVAQGCRFVRQKHLLKKSATDGFSMDLNWGFQGLAAWPNLQTCSRCQAWPPGKGARPSRSLRRAGRKRVPLCIEAPKTENSTTRVTARTTKIKERISYSFWGSHEICRPE